MELVLIKNKENIKVYQGSLDYHEEEHYFFASVTPTGEIKDIVVYTLSEDHQMKTVDEYTKGQLIGILADEYICHSV